NLCHNETYLTRLHINDLTNYDCYTCHAGKGSNYGSTALRIIQEYKANGRQPDNKAGCPDCHPNVTGVKNDPQTLSNTAHVTLHDPNSSTSSPCNIDCHVETDLPAVHHNNLTSSCLTCHATYARIEAQNAIAKYKLDGTKAGCKDCHETLDHTTLHVPNPATSATCIAAECHGDNPLPVIHEPNDCSLCHGAGVRQEVQDAILNYKNNGTFAGCNDCHANANHGALHTISQNENASCVNCHVDPVDPEPKYLPNIHTASGQNISTSCPRCHSSVDPKVQNAILKYSTDKIEENKAICNDCHTNLNHVTLHTTNPNTSVPCMTCHIDTDHQYLPDVHTAAGQNISTSCSKCHSSLDSTVQNAILKYSTDKIEANKAGCNDCHKGETSPHTCVTCHENNINGRRAITPEFRLRSHHVTTVSVTPDDCMDCHDISKHAQGTVYLKNADGGSAIAYNPDNTSSATPFCLGCHDSDSKNSRPFSDNNKPISSAKNWDSMDIETKFSNLGTADSNKYPPTVVPPGLSAKGWKYNTVPNEKKAYSPHGNPSNNEPNGNTSDTQVACLDCHNSHGSGLPTIIKTTATYTPASIEDFCWNCHLNAQNAPDKASAYLKDPGNNIVRDYYGGYRWGENDGTGFKGDWLGAFTFKNGRFMSSHFFPSKTHDLSNTWSRSTIGCTDCHDPHGINPGLANAKYMVPILKGTWLVSPFKEDRPPLTSFDSHMPETVQEGEEGYVNGKKPRSRPDLNFNNPPDPGAGYADGTGGLGHEGFFIEENTLGAYGTYAKHDENNNITINRIAEDDTKFAGLCLKCHTKTNLKSAWSGHGVVKGWGGASKDIFTSSIANNTQNEGEEGSDNFSWGVKLRSQQSSGFIQNDYHQFTCSKCHSPHASRLKRLMITNCLDNKGKHSEFSDMLRVGATNCHSTSRGNGWNDETPWIPAATPATPGTVDTAILSPATSNILTGNNQLMTFTAKNNKTYKLKYYYVELSYNLSALNVTNLVCTPAANYTSLDIANRKIIIQWEDVDPRVVLMVNFSCNSNNAGTFNITKSKIEYENNLGQKYAGNCNSAVINVTVPDTQAPGIPANLSGTAVSKSQINLTWSASTDNVGVKGYNVYKNGTKIATTTSTSYSASGLSSSTYYKFKVSAYDAAGNTSGFSTEITVKTLSR
ncbi:hypothetical protein HY745_10360, partial [Candidatus Desantisbacteria bacterium]|nr:hypothetical protein [Candidatus Desantisbacteria bacterium]